MRSSKRAKFQDLQDQRAPGERKISKVQAARHLLHASIRMHLSQEDPFANHLIIQSCDKILIGLHKSKGIVSRLDFSVYVKEEFLAAFYFIHREVYNYLKHGDDPEELLDVRNICAVNEMAIFLNCVRYLELPNNAHTKHAEHYINFVSVRTPDLFKSEAIQEVSAKLRESDPSMSYRDYVSMFRASFLADALVQKEMDEDLSDVRDANSAVWWRERKTAS